MAARTISLEFDGYWREPKVGGVPAESGVYVLYECTYNSEKKKVSLKRILYIGEADDVRDRLKNHEKWPKCHDYCSGGSQLCCSFAAISKPDRLRAQAALIFEHKPPVNTDYKVSFPFDQTSITAEGEVTLLTKRFTVERT